MNSPVIGERRTASGGALVTIGGVEGVLRVIGVSGGKPSMLSILTSSALAWDGSGAVSVAGVRWTDGSADRPVRLDRSGVRGADGQLSGGASVCAERLT